MLNDEIKKKSIQKLIQSKKNRNRK
jgi:hypothetical protein